MKILTPFILGLSLLICSCSKQSTPAPSSGNTNCYPAKSGYCNGDSVTNHKNAWGGDL